MATTIFTYIFILLVCVGITSLTPKNVYGEHSLNQRIKYYIYVTIPIVIYTLFWGLRYNVGADYSSYVSLFYNMNDDIEIGYKTLNRLLKEFGFDYVSVFIITSFFPILSIYIISRKESKLFACLLIYFFFTTSLVFFTQNGIRQAIALFIMLILISKIKNIKFISFIIFSAFAVIFHKSAIVPIVLIAILYLVKTIKINKFILISLLIALTIFGRELYDFFFSRFSFLFELLNYSTYEENMSNYEKTLELSSGMGILLKLCLNSMVIFYQDKLFDKNKTPIYYFYTLFLIGILIEPIIAENFIMRRMNVYFIETKFVIYTYFCTYLLNTKKYTGWSKFMAIIFILAWLLLYIAAILSNSNKCMPYQTIFYYK